MKSVMYKGKNNIRIEDVGIPKISENELLVKVKAASICGTDIKITKFGHFKNPNDDPIILGHEFSGEIAEVGENISKFPKGMRVAIAPNIGCGHCRECISGLTHLCQDYEAFGITFYGGFADFVKVPYSYISQGNIFELPANMSFEEGALVEPLAAAFNGIEAARINLSDNVLIVGAGPMGILNLMLAKLKGAQKVIISEINSERIKTAKDFGADYVINPENQDLISEVKNLTLNRGADVIITAVSSAKVQEQTIDLVARCGRIVFFGGLPKGVDTINFKTNDIHYKQILVTGTTGSSIVQYKKSLELAASKKINLERIISKRFNLSNAEEAFKYAILPSTLKVLIVN